MKSQAKTSTSHSPIETLRESAVAIGSGVKKSVQKDLVQDGWKDFFNQLLTSSEKAQSTAKKGEMKAGQEIFLHGKKSVDTMHNKKQEATPEKKKNPNILGGIDYRSEIVHAGERMSRREQGELNQKVDQIMSELKRLIATSATLEKQFRMVTVDQKPTNVGKYHVNFMEWMLSWMKNMNKNAQDAGAYLRSLNTKKSQRKYGNMAKKHGTTFTLSNERGIATQNG